MHIDNRFSKFCLGTVQFGKSYGLRTVRDNEIKDNEIMEIFNFFHSKGGIYVDTAQNYGDSEKVISNYLKPESRVISKLYLTNLDNEVEGLIFKSLNNLKIDSLDTILVHNPEILLETPSLINNLIDMKEQKLVNNIGISIYSYEDICNSDDSNLNEILLNIDVIQVQGNAFDKEFFLDKRFSTITNNKIRIDIRSIFLQGLLLQDFQTASKLFPSHEEELLDWHNYCLKNSLTKIEASILNSPKPPENSEFLTLFGCRNLSEIKDIYKSIIGLDNLEFKNFTCNFPEALIDPRLWK